MKNRFYNAGPKYSTNPTVQASDIAFSIHTAVDSAFFDVEYPDLEWGNIVTAEQVMSDINVGATSYAQIVRDKTGAAAFIGNGPNNDIPMVAQAVSAVQIPIGYSAVGAVVTNEDARQYTFGFNGNLASDLGEAMRMACDNLVETSVVFGYEPLGFHGYYPGIDVVTPAVGTSGDTEWSTKTATEIMLDVNNALTSMWENSRTLMKPTDVFLPMQQYALLTTTPMTLNGTPLTITIMEYLAKNNVITSVTGREVVFHPSRYLSDAGTGGSARMVIMDRRKNNQILPFPMPYLLSQPIPTPLAAQWYAEQKHGSYYVKQKGSMMYMDEI